MTSPIKKIRHITRVGKRSRCIVIPANMIEELGWKDRQKMEISFVRNGRKIIITEQKSTR